MRRMLSLFLIVSQALWLAVPPVLAVDTQTAQETPKMGYLVITSTRAGAEVMLDGRFVGLTPLDTLAVSPGRHELVVINPNKTSWLDRDWSSVVEVRAGEVTEAKIVFQKAYSVNSKPFGATVSVGDSVLGDTPLIVYVPDTTEALELALVKDGFLPDTLRLDEWAERFVEVELRPHPGAQLQHGFARSVADEGVGRSWKWTYISAGAALVSGVTALYFKNRADDTYERYLQAIDPAEIDRLYDQTRRYDTYATVSFVLFQVSFLSSVYLFVKNVNR